MASSNIPSSSSPLSRSKMDSNLSSFNGFQSPNLIFGHETEAFLGTKLCPITISKSNDRFKASLLPKDLWKTSVSLSSGIEIQPALDSLETDSIPSMNSFPHDADGFDLDLPTPGFSSIPEAIEDIRQGKMVVVVDDEDRENEGDLIMEASSVTPEAMAFIVKYGTGIVCVSMKAEDLERLQLPLMVTHNEDKNRTAFTVSVDAKHGTTTGVSAHDRATTIKALASKESKPDDFNRPGHIFPLKYREGGVLKRAGHTEASVDLAVLAGFDPVAVLCEVVDDDGSMARLPKLRKFVEKENLKIISIGDLIRYRRKTDKLVEQASAARIPTTWGPFVAYCYRSVLDGMEHIAMVKGEIGDGNDILVRVHSECLTGDIFGSARCDCGNQLALSMQQIEDAGRGVLVYLRGHEGRGIGIGHKLRAYNLQDDGRDTVEANEELGLPVDSREYGIGAQILRDLGVRKMKLLTNNPAKYIGLKGYGLEVAGRVPLLTLITEHNKRYIETKRTKMGHMVMVVDDEDRENEGDLVMAASAATPEAMAFFVKHGTGIVCVSMKGEDLERLQLPLMVTHNEDKNRTAFTVSVDAKHGTTTGVSAHDRATTIKALASKDSKPEDFNRPGHIFPLRYKEGGVLKRPGHTEASVDLAILAGFDPVAVICEVVDDDGSMARLPKLRQFVEKENLKIISIADLIRYRRKTDNLVEQVSAARIPTTWGPFVAYCYKSILNGMEHVAMVKGEIGDGNDILVRVHSECLTGDIYGSARCDCGNQLALSMQQIEDAGRGVVVYLRGHEGRGIGLGHKLRAYNLQDDGRDTVEANEDLGLPVDSREYDIAAQILKDLGVRKMKLMTNNPAKYIGLKGYGLEVTGRVPLLTLITEDNKRYLETKRTKMGHVYGSGNNVVSLINENDKVHSVNPTN